MSLYGIYLELHQELDIINGHFRKGLGFFDLQMFRDSAREFEVILKYQPDLQLVRLFYAISMMASSKYNVAEFELNALLNQSVDHAIQAAAWEALAQLYAENHQYELARDALMQVIELRESSVDAHLNLAICSYTLGDYGQAAIHAMNAAKLDPHDVLAWRIAGATLHTLRQNEEALTAYEEAMLHAPKHPLIKSEVARVLTTLSRTAEATAMYKELMQHHEWAAEAYLGMAEIELMNRRYQEAMVYLKKRLSILRNDQKSLLWLGFAYYGDQELKKASDIFQQLQNTSPPISLLASTGLARIAADSHQEQLAKQHLRVLFAQHDIRWRAHGLAEYGYLYAKLAQPHISVQFLKKAMALDPSQPDANTMVEWLT